MTLSAKNKVFRKTLTLVQAMVAVAEWIGDYEVLRSGSTGKVVGAADH